jgi:hypothetical protein
MLVSVTIGFLIALATRRGSEPPVFAGCDCRAGFATASVMLPRRDTAATSVSESLAAWERLDELAEDELFGTSFACLAGFLAGSVSLGLEEEEAKVDSKLPFQLTRSSSLAPVEEEQSETAAAVLAAAWLTMPRLPRLFWLGAGGGPDSLLQTSCSAFATLSSRDFLRTFCNSST